MTSSAGRFLSRGPGASGRPVATAWSASVQETSGPCPRIMPKAKQSHVDCLPEPLGSPELMQRRISQS
eukprot:7720840-Alexandrium_andersonii.AAC.1